MQILIAPDSFKGSLSASRVCVALSEGISKASDRVRSFSVPMADGGEGTVEAIIESLDGEKVTVTVHDPLMRKIQADFGIVRHQNLAIIEMAAASGLELLNDEEQNPAVTTTYGTGELIRHALDLGCRRFIVGIGGSATNDGGSGMLQALGVRFESADTAMQGGAFLKRISRINMEFLDPRLKEAELEIACDVNNPLTGPQGASHIYGPQKGADEALVRRLDENLIHFGRLLEEVTGRNISEIPGAGAAGGLGAGFLALPQAVLRSGFDIIAEATGLEKAIREADWVFTGEGRVDGQTLSGKVVQGVGLLAKKHRKPAVCIAGTIGNGSEVLYQHGITAIFSILNAPMSLEKAKKNAFSLLKDNGENLTRLILQSLPPDSMQAH